MPTKTVLAFHFVGETLRDGKPIPENGVWLKHTGPVVMCGSGFHASRQPFDALQYAPGATLCKVRVRGDIREQDDKLVGRERLIVARIDATDLLRSFARKCALDCIKAWDAPDVVVQYLKTGDESLRSAAESAAWSAAESAARSAAWAAWSAAWSAARSAAWSAAESAARSAAWAAWSAARSAAWLAADSAAESAHRKRFNSMVREAFRKQARK